MILIISIIVAIASIVGLVNLTQYAFAKNTIKMTDSKVAVAVESNKVMYIFGKIAVVLLWIQVAIGILMVMKKMMKY